MSESVTDTLDSSASSEDDSNDDNSTCALGPCDPDSGPSIFECDVWAQDCPVGEKCMPWASDGGTRWNATRCSPLDPDVGAPGDPCIVEGNIYSGIDDCGADAMCWNVDVDTNAGICAPNCVGSEGNPLCLGDANLHCFVEYESTVHVCLPGCDALLQDCANGWICTPYAEDFSCVPDGSGDGGGYGTACEGFDRCDPGLYCATPQFVPGCVDPGCCTDFCDLDLADPNSQCAGVGDGAECIAWTGAGDAAANLGSCGLAG